MARYPLCPLKLTDCRDHGPLADNELFIVEGDSAAASVCRVRNPQTQAVLPMQGKPLNALKASPARVAANPWFKALIAALGGRPDGTLTPAALRYRRIVLLFDPDADGIHSGALMLMYFHRFLPQALEQGRVLMSRPPLFRVTAPGLAGPRYAGSPAHHARLVAQLRERDIGPLQTLRYRGLGSLEESLLIDACVAPATRCADPMSAGDAAMAIQVFGGS
ncbi:MAG: toprim domain-containing protein [Burkholderiaceae bacterium]